MLPPVGVNSHKSENLNRSFVRDQDELPFRGFLPLQCLDVKHPGFIHFPLEQAAFQSDRPSGNFPEIIYHAVSLIRARVKKKNPQTY